MPRIETLPLLLKQLGLPTMFEKWEKTESIAQEKSWRHADYLSALCEFEAANRYQKRVSRHIKESKLPPGKTLATFDFSAAKSVPRLQIEALSENIAWVKQANNLVIFGPSGVGKTHLAAAIAHRLIEQGIRVLFTSTTSLVQKLQDARQKYQLPQALEKLARFPVLILDDIGYAKKDEMETSVLFELIADRYENVSLVITANQPFGEWDSIFPDNMMAIAAIDRLVHHSSIINITDDSYRKNHATQQHNKKGGK